MLKYNRKVRRVLANLKRITISLGGLRQAFKLEMFNKDWYVEYSLRGRRPERDYSVIMQLASGKKCMFDVGANHGIITLLMKAANSGCEIHAFEASEEAVRIISENISLNELAGIKVVNALVADRSGIAIPFYIDGSSGGASITKGRLGHIQEIYKATISLDDYTSALQLRPDFIKIDIEGAESLAIKGMSEILRTLRPWVFVELHELGELKLHENADLILKFIEPRNYLMIYLRSGKPIDSVEVLMDRGRCHVLLLPTEEYGHWATKNWDLSGL